jgi:outer membrane protein assembly factor BamB
MALVVSCCLVLNLAPAVAAGAAHRTRATSTEPAWTVYHGSAAGTGDVAGPSFLHARSAWTSAALDGQLYGEPLEATGRVFVATEDDSVYALSAKNGSVLWRTHLATPVPSSDLPCGDVTPTVGITGTPVIDTARAEIFVVADEEVNGAAVHEVVGLNIYTGSVVMHQDADPPGSKPLNELQRTGVALDGNEVVFGFGGNDGDCAYYHGWVEAAPVAGGTPSFFEVDQAAGDDQGAIWMGGAAPEVDASGDIWVSAGNGSVGETTSPYDDSDSVLELSPSLSLLQYFAPSDWRYDNANDRDLGSAPPVLVGGSVVQAGKSQTAFLLKGSALGGIGGQEAQLSLCNAWDIDGGAAVSGSVVYLPCQAQLTAVQVSASPPSLVKLWATTSGASAPPILAGGLLWAMGGNTLYGLDPQNGRTAVSLWIGRPQNHFPTPSVGDGLLLVPGSTKVLAYSGSAGRPGAPTPAPAAP